jgi:hypothetical protein
VLGGGTAWHLQKLQYIKYIITEFNPPSRKKFLRKGLDVDGRKLHCHLLWIVVVYMFDFFIFSCMSQVFYHESEKGNLLFAKFSGVGGVGVTK